MLLLILMQNIFYFYFCITIQIKLLIILLFLKLFVLFQILELRKIQQKMFQIYYLLLTKKKHFRDTFPIFSNSLSFNFTANGDTIASTKLGNPKIILADIIDISIKLSDTNVKFFTNTFSSIGIMLVKIADNSINCDNIFISCFLSAILPPM